MAAETTFSQDLIAGTIGGVMGIAVGQPADTIKVRLQTQGATSSQCVAGSSGAAAKVYKGSLDCAGSILRHEGPQAFFKGILAPIVANAPINATIFVVYGQALRGLREWKQKREPVRLRNRTLCRNHEAVLGPQYHFMAGSLGGLCQTIFATPNELLKIKEQVVRGKSQSTVQVAAGLVRRHGVVRGLFQGWTLTALRDVPAFGVYFASYELCKQSMMARSYDSVVSSFCAGGTAGMLSFLLLHPVDVLKSCRQMQAADAARDSTSIVSLARVGMQQSGPSFFLRGLGPSVLRAAPVSAVIFVVYEQVLDFLQQNGL